MLKTKRERNKRPSLGGRQREKRTVLAVPITSSSTAGSALIYVITNCPLDLAHPYPYPALLLGFVCRHIIKIFFDSKQVFLFGLQREGKWQELGMKGCVHVLSWSWSHMFAALREIIAFHAQSFRCVLYLTPSFSTYLITEGEDNIVPHSKCLIRSQYSFKICLIREDVDPLVLIWRG